MRRQAVARAGAARTEGTLAASAGGGAQRHPARLLPALAAFPCAVWDQAAEWTDAKSSGVGMRLIHDSAIYLALPKSP